MDQELKDYIYQPINYSEEFDQYVIDLVTRSFNPICPYYHIDKDMNYRASQVVRLHLNDDYVSCEYNSSNVTRQLLYYISSKGPFFARVLMAKTADNLWELLPESLQGFYFCDVVQKIDDQLCKSHLTLLEGEVLKEIVPGLTTDMDGVPATVFEVMFAELY